MKTIQEIIEDLRQLNWDEPVTCLYQEIIPSALNKLMAQENLTEEDIHTVNTCVKLIQEAISNQDIVLLCDLLEYEFAIIIERMLMEEGRVYEP